MKEKEKLMSKGKKRKEKKKEKKGRKKEKNSSFGWIWSSVISSALPLVPRGGNELQGRQEYKKREQKMKDMRWKNEKENEREREKKDGTKKQKICLAFCLLPKKTQCFA